MRSFFKMLVCLNALATPAMATQCLDVKDIKSFTQGGRSGVQVTTVENRLFDVSFKAACPYHLSSHFVYQRWQYGRCLKPGDSLQIAGGGACVVAEVTEKPSNLPPGSGRGNPGPY
jgi:hypothetical protein